MSTKSLRRFAAQLLATTVSAALVVTPAVARKASTLTDLVGVEGASGETQLKSRGFEHIKTDESAGSTKYGYWWHAGDKNCIRVTTSEGRYTAIADASKGDCDKKSSNKGVATAAAVGAVALTALLLSRKSKDRTDRGYQHDWQQVEVHGLKSSRLNIYDGPSKRARLLGQVGNGALLRNYGCDDYNGTSWCEVATMDGVTRGWAKDKYLRVTSAGVGHYPSYGDGGDLVEVHGLSEPLKIRSGLSKNDDVVGRVNVGTTLRRLGCQYSEGENWCHVVTLDGQMNGWAREKYLRSTGAGNYPSYGGGSAGYDYVRGPGGLEERCLRAVSQRTGNARVSTDRIEESEAATGIYVTVQGAAAHWRCLGYRDGTIGEVRYMGSD